MLCVVRLCRELQEYVMRALVVSVSCPWHHFWPDAVRHVCVTTCRCVLCTKLAVVWWYPLNFLFDRVLYTACVHPALVSLCRTSMWWWWCEVWIVPILDVLSLCGCFCCESVSLKRQFVLQRVECLCVMGILSWHCCLKHSAVAGLSRKCNIYCII